MRKIFIIGIGSGNPEHLTVEAIRALNQVDVFFIPDKGTEKAALRQLRLDICERFIERPGYRMVGIDIPQRAPNFSDYRANVADWHAVIADRYRALLETELGPDQIGGLLVWGDPALYDSTLRIIDSLQTEAFSIDYEVIPGISSVQVLAARHRIPLNTIGEPVLFTTGRKLAMGLPADIDSVVVMLDGEQAFGKIENSEDYVIYWGAYLGMESEMLVAGRLIEVRDRIHRLRAEARERFGWIMDTYLLRRVKRD